MGFYSLASFAQMLIYAKQMYFTDAQLYCGVYVEPIDGQPLANVLFAASREQPILFHSPGFLSGSTLIQCYTPRLKGGQHWMRTLDAQAIRLAVDKRWPHEPRNVIGAALELIPANHPLGKVRDATPVPGKGAVRPVLCPQPKR
jgi:hypothetical protein